jgi:uncharacterized protein (DUF58 family)
MNIDLKKVKEFGNIELLARQMVEGFITGLHKSPYHGFSVEFAEHKIYNTGESTRHMDWKVYAKTEKLFTKRYEEETNLRCVILIDTSSSMYYPVENHGKMTFSIMAAACLAYLLQRQRDAVGIYTFSNEIEIQTPISSTSSHIHKLFLILENLLKDKAKDKKTSIAPVIHDIADKIHKRSLVIIFTDVMDDPSRVDDFFSSLQHLKHNNHEALLFHVKDKRTEVDFDFAERPYEFIDIESGEKIKVQPSEIKDFYKNQMKKFEENLKLKAGQFKIDLIEADIEKSFSQVLLPYLIKRAKMK